MEMMREMKKQFGHLKVVTTAVQDEVTSAVIRSIDDVKRESGAAEALKVAGIFSKAIALYDEGLPLATAMLAAAELSKDRKNAAKILGFAAISITSVLPYMLINQEEFEDYLCDLREDAKNANGRKRTKTAKVTRLKPRKKS